MIDVVITTIGDGSFLKTWDRMVTDSSVRLVVIPDVNTPAALYEQVRNCRIPVLCPEPDEQCRFLAKIGCPKTFIPWKSDNRRNVGYLMAWASGAKAVISADDDNFPLDGKWLAGHQVVLFGPRWHQVVSSGSGWFNAMGMLAAKPHGQYWQRGFPFFARHDDTIREVRERADVSINQGLWIGDPDVDAVTRLGAHPETAQLISDYSLVLARDTWAPVNSQNTAVRRDVIPAYWFTGMPEWAGRWGDILQGYFAEACAKHLGHSVMVGTPLVRQDRNQHHLLSDLELEFPFYRPMEAFLQWLPETRLSGRTYRDTYESLSHALRDYAETCREPVKGFFRQTASGMRTWLKLCDQIGTAQ